MDSEGGGCKGQIQQLYYICCYGLLGLNAIATPHYISTRDTYIESIYNYYITCATIVHQYYWDYK